MSYDSLTRDRNLIDYLFHRKIFKKNYFIEDNKEGYEWDDYDTTHFYPKVEDNPNHVIVNFFKDNYRKIHITKDYIKYFYQEGDVYKHFVIVNYFKDNY